MKQSKRVLSMILSAALCTMYMPMAGAAANADPTTCKIVRADRLDMELPEIVETTTTEETMAPTDAPPELLIGKPYTLYNIPLSDYLAGTCTVKFECGANCAELIADETVGYLQIVGTAPGYVVISYKSIESFFDAYGRIRGTDCTFEVVAQAGTQTKTNASSYTIQLGGQRALHFWNPATMTAEDAEIKVTEGSDCIRFEYQPGSDRVTVQALQAGTAILEITEKNCDAPCIVLLKIEDPEAEVPTEYETDPTDPNQETTTTATTTTTTVVTHTTHLNVNTEPTEPMQTTAADGTHPLDSTANTTTTTTTTTTVVASTGSTTETATSTTVKPSLGDLNGDAAVNAEDGADILIDSAQYGASKLHAIPEEYVNFADVNHDGMVNAGDATIVLSYAAEAGSRDDMPAFADYAAELPQTRHMVVAYTQRRLATSWADDTVKVFHSLKEAEESIGSISDVLRDTGLKEYGTEEGFFQNYSLIMIQKNLPSGSITPEFQSLSDSSQGIFTANFNLITPNIQTADMAFWQFFIVTDKSFPDAEHIKAEFTTVPESAADARHLAGAKEIKRHCGEDTPADPVLIFTSPDSMEAYFTQNMEMSYIREDRAEILEELKNTYDEAFFAEHSLILFQKTEGSGSIKLNVTDFTLDGSTYTLHVGRTSPEVQTCDMAYWYLFAETDTVLTNPCTICVDIVTNHGTHDTIGADFD